MLLRISYGSIKKSIFSNSHLDVYVEESFHMLQIYKEQKVLTLCRYQKSYFRKPCLIVKKTIVGQPEMLVAIALFSRMFYKDFWA